MIEDSLNQILLIASDEELSGVNRVWGTGGWTRPEQREALDWFTLSRLLGWGATTTQLKDSNLDARWPNDCCWIVLACDPDCLSQELTAMLAMKLASEPISVVARAAAPGSALAQLAGAAHRPQQITGHSICWTGTASGREWCCRKALESNALELQEGTRSWCALDESPLIVARQVGRGTVVTLGFHPSHARDTDGAATALLRHLLVCGSAKPVAWLDLEGVLVLRMDDPGGAQNIFSKSWTHTKLGEAAWETIGDDLRRRNARLSIGYVGGWVDDGNPMRGKLEVAGESPSRVPGQVCPSPLVRYQDIAGHAPGTLHDYESEFRGIQRLRAAGLGDVELHGYTHMHPDSTSWAKAPDRYETMTWYRELGPDAKATIAARSREQHPLALGLANLRRFFNVHPTTLICPGDQWTNEVIERAADLRLHFVSNYYLALHDNEHFCWATHVCAPYLDEPNASWFDAGLPVIGYFHDRDLSLEGVDWIKKWLDRWRDAGAQRMIDFRELASAVSRRLRVETSNGDLRLIVTSRGAPDFVRPLPIIIRSNEGRLPSHITVLLDGKEFSLQAHLLKNGFGRLVLPV